jgi:hypothetical protein
VDSNLESCIFKRQQMNAGSQTWAETANFQPCTNHRRK